MTLNTPYSPIRPVTPVDLPAVVDLLSSVFDTDPLVHWLFPDPARRRLRQARLYRRMLAPPAEVSVLGSGDAVAVWHRTEDGRAPGGGGAPATEAVLGNSAPRLRALGDALAEVHPRGRFRVLSCMAVAAGRQGAGLGSALLRDGLEHGGGLGVYLEASTPRSRALYQRFGFADLGPAVRTGDSPPVWPMWRPPASVPGSVAEVGGGAR